MKKNSNTRSLSEVSGIPPKKYKWYVRQDGIRNYQKKKMLRESRGFGPRDTNCGGVKSVHCKFRVKK